MSYGQNQPWGLQATKTLTAATWSGQTNPYFVDPTTGNTATSIFRGDPVVMNQNGFIVSLFETGPVAKSASIVGVFDGCSYVTPTSANPIDPASPGRPYWPAGTQTLNNSPVTAFVIDDPNTVFDIQTNATPGLNQGNMGNTANVAAGAGNTNTGISTASLDQGTLATTATNNLKLIRLVARTGNEANVGYNNAEVIIQNHFYATRPAGI